MTTPLDPIEVGRFRVRAARLPDAPSVASCWLRLAVETAEHDPSFALGNDADQLLAERVRDDLWHASEDDLYLLAVDPERDERPVGFCLARIIEVDPLFADVIRAELECVWVDPECRRAGLARAMLVASSGWASARNALWLQARVAWRNEASAKLFEQAGLAPSARWMAGRLGAPVAPAGASERSGERAGEDPARR